MPALRTTHILAGFIGTLPLAALAEETAGVPPSSYVQTVLALFLVIGIFVGAAWLMRKIGMARPGSASGVLKLVGSLPVGPRERILIVEIGDTWLIVGCTPGQMRTLHTLPRPPADQIPNPETPAFAHWLKQLGERPGQKP